MVARGVAERPNSEDFPKSRQTGGAGESAMPRGRRSRARILATIPVVVALGLGSRRFARSLPWFVAAHGGDTLWALAAYLGVVLLRPAIAPRSAALVAGALALAVELSQLYKAPWIDALRRTTLGALILGFDFVWSDLACYAVGILAGVALDRAVVLGRGSMD
jgi:hypothetical protein